MGITEKYYIKKESKETKPGCWNILDITIYMKQEDGIEIEIGKYTRNYHSFYKTFFPFVKNSKEYALVSKNYTCYEVISLPSCETVASIPPSGFGFCPVEFYVPDETEGSLGFMAGCVWGDDSSWKIRPIDLRKIEEGKVETLNSFGYIERTEDSIKDSINYITKYERGEKTTYLINLIGAKTYEVFDSYFDLKCNSLLNAMIEKNIINEENKSIAKKLLDEYLVEDE